VGARSDKKELLRKTKRFELIRYLSDPENNWPKRFKYSIILGFNSDNHIYTLFTPEELTEIEGEAFELLQAQSHKKRKNVYDKLYEKATKGTGDVKAIELLLNRLEGMLTNKTEVDLKTPVQFIMHTLEDKKDKKDKT